MGGLLSLLGGVKAYLIVAAVAAVMAGSGAFTLAWKLQDATVERMKAADAKQLAADEAAAIKASQVAAAQAYQAGVDDEAKQAAIQGVYGPLIQKVPVYVTRQADARCVVPLGAIRLLDASAFGLPTPTDLGRPSQSDDAPSGVDLSSLVALEAGHDKTYQEVATRLRDLQALVGKHRPAAPSSP